MSTLTAKLPTTKLSTDRLPIDLDDAKKPVFAAVGVVDLYVEQVKDLPAEAKKVQEKLQGKIEAARVARTAQLKTVPAQLKALPTQAKELSNEITAYYAKLAVRGEKLVGQIRRQPSTEAAIAEGKAAVKKAEAAANNAKRAAKAGEQAVEDAAAKIG